MTTLLKLKALKKKKGTTLARVLDAELSAYTSRAHACRRPSDLEEGSSRLVRALTPSPRRDAAGLPSPGRPQRSGRQLPSQRGKVLPQCSAIPSRPRKRQGHVSPRSKSRPEGSLGCRALRKHSVGDLRRNQPRRPPGRSATDTGSHVARPLAISAFGYSAFAGASGGLHWDPLARCSICPCCWRRRRRGKAQDGGQNARRLSEGQFKGNFSEILGSQWLCGCVVGPAGAPGSCGGWLRFGSAFRLREEARAPPPPWCAGWERPGLAARSPPGFGSRPARPGAGGGGRSGRAGPGRGGGTGERGRPRGRARGARRPRGAAAPGRGGNRAAQGFPGSCSGTWSPLASGLSGVLEGAAGPGHATPHTWPSPQATARRMFSGRKGSRRGRGARSGQPLRWPVLFASAPGLSWATLGASSDGFCC